MTPTEWFDRYRITQSWEQHLKNAGVTLGGVDHAMPIGTALPILDGELEWITPATPFKNRPAWYNTGLGNAAAYLRPDGTRTVYGHCSRRDGRQVYSGNTGKSTGAHVHVHDVLADGTTRARPLSTIQHTRRRTTMMLFHTPNTDANKTTYPVVYWLVAENGARAQFVGGQAFANAVAAQLGPSIATDMAFLDIICKRLQDSQPSTAAGGATPTAVADELAARLKA